MSMKKKRGNVLRFPGQPNQEKQADPRKKMSEIIKEMACTVMADPERVPSSEAAHASLLFAHTAWERATRRRRRALPIVLCSGSSKCPIRPCGAS